MFLFTLSLYTICFIIIFWWWFTVLHCCWWVNFSLRVVAEDSLWSRRGQSCSFDFNQSAGRIKLLLLSKNMTKKYSHSYSNLHTTYIHTHSYTDHMDSIGPSLGANVNKQKKNYGKKKKKTNKTLRNRFVAPGLIACVFSERNWLNLSLDQVIPSVLPLVVKSGRR